MSNEFSTTADEPEGRPPSALEPDASECHDGSQANTGDGERDHTTLPDGASSKLRSRIRLWRAQHPRKSQVADLGLIVVFALVLSFLIKTFLMQPFVIPSESMEDTFIRGDRIVVSKLSTSLSDVRRGDIVVFKDADQWLGPVPEQSSNPVRNALETIGVLPDTENQYLVKRIIGVGGDQVTCCTEQGNLTVNGVAIDEPYLKPGAIPSQISFDVTVPEGKLWVMGDNRQNSGDSRFHLGSPGGGFVDEDQVVGTVFATVWPLNRLHWHTNPEDTFANVPDDPPAQESAVDQ